MNNRLAWLKDVVNLFCKLFIGYESSIKEIQSNDPLTIYSIIPYPFNKPDVEGEKSIRSLIKSWGEVNKVKVQSVKFNHKNKTVKITTSIKFIDEAQEWRNRPKGLDNGENLKRN